MTAQVIRGFVFNLIASSGLLAIMLLAASIAYAEVSISNDGVTFPDGIEQTTAYTGPTGLQGYVFELPGSGGSGGLGSLLVLNTSNPRVSFRIFCNYSIDAYSMTQVGADAGDIEYTYVIDGESIRVFQIDPADGFDTTPATFPLHGVFIINDLGALTRWEVIVNERPNGDCSAVVYGPTLGPGSGVFQP